MNAALGNTGKWLLAGLVLAGAGAAASWVAACPFCSAVSLTFTEEINNSQVAVFARLVEPPPRAEGGAAPANSLDVAKAKFEITKVLKGDKELAGKQQIEVVYFGDSPKGAMFLVMGIDPPAVNWGTPIAISPRGQEYVERAIALPQTEADRLAFFQDYLEDSDEMLARDAYDEFAKTPYAGVIALRERMKHDKLIEWIKSPQVPVSHRRLYLTMLGVCGQPEDLPLLEEMIKSKDRQTKGALDALVAAYLTLKGADGLPLVEDLYLKNKDAEYTDTYATIMALRFHGTEEKIVPRDRLLVAIRHMLDRPQLADLVIPDLARWEDWSVIDRLVALFKNADEDSNWVRVPVINYLRACPLPAAKERIDELAKIDPETVKRASTLFFPLGAGGAPAAAANDKPGDEAGDAKVGGDTAQTPAGTPVDEKQKTGAAGSDASGTKAPESKPAATKPAANASSQQSSGVVPGQTSAVGRASGPAADKEQAAGGLTAGARLSKDAALPPAPEGGLGVYLGLATAAVLLAGAFWVILKGGQHAAG